MPQSLRGRLLIASPALVDPNFRRTVVLVIAHDDDGAVGLVLNRKTEATVGDAIPALVDLTGSDALVSVGGPVQPEAVCVLAEWDDPDDAGQLVFGDVGLMAAEAELESVAPATRRVRVFAGYAGWGSGQLEAELDEPSWLVEDADVDDIFGGGDVWAAALRRKGGEYTFLATMPEDPSLN